MAKIESNVVKNSEEKANVVNMDSVSTKLRDTLTIDTESCFTTLESGVEISQKKYDFRNPIGKKESITVYDATIIASMEKISAALKARNIVGYVICRELANIQNSGKLESMGFKNIAEFGKAVYDLEPSTVNHYAKIGNCFINADYSVKAGLPDLSVSHLIELNALVDENGAINGIVELFVNGTLVDGMSTKKMREVLKNLKSGNTIEQKSDNSDNSAESEDKSENTASSEATSTTTAESPKVMETLAKEYDEKVAVAQLLAHCKAMTEIIAIMAENGADVKAITAEVDKVSATAKKFL